MSWPDHGYGGCTELETFYPRNFLYLNYTCYTCNCIIFLRVIYTCFNLGVAQLILFVFSWHCKDSTSQWGLCFVWTVHGGFPEPKLPMFRSCWSIQNNLHIQVSVFAVLNRYISNQSAKQQTNLHEYVCDALWEWLLMTTCQNWQFFSHFCLEDHWIMNSWMLE